MHRHASIRSLERETVYRGPTTSSDTNPAAHGNITRQETCRCGAVRWLNINGNHREAGNWYHPEDAT